MTITPAQFVIDFPDFANTAIYPVPSIQYWLNLAYLMLPAPRWSTLLDTGAELFAAHNLVLEQQANAANADGGSPGGEVGPLASNSGGPASVSYDTGAGTIPGDSHWNLTTYGTRFRRLSRQFGAGGLQIGATWPPAGTTTIPII